MSGGSPLSAITLRMPTDRVVGPVHALVELLDDLDEPDRIDVPYAGRAWIAAHARRIAAQRDHAPNAERMGAEQLRLQRHQIAVARGEVDQRLDAHTLFGQRGEGDTSHAHAGHRAIADVDAIRASGLDQRRAFEHLGRVEAARRVDFDADAALAT